MDWLSSFGRRSSLSSGNPDKVVLCNCPGKKRLIFDIRVQIYDYEGLCEEGLICAAIAIAKYEARPSLSIPIATK